MYNEVGLTKFYLTLSQYHSNVFFKSNANYSHFSPHGLRISEYLRDKDWLAQPAEDDRRDSRSTASNDLAKTLHLQWSWQTKDELHKINMSHIVRLLTAANKRVSAYTRSDQDFIKKTWRMVENVKSTDYEAKGRARDLPQPSIFHLKDLSLHALHCTGR